MSCRGGLAAFCSSRSTTCIAGLSATGLAESMTRLAKWGAVETDTSMVEEFLVWSDLEKTARASRLAFVLTPNELLPASVCR